MSSVSAPPRPEPGRDGRRTGRTRPVRQWVRPWRMAQTFGRRSPTSSPAERVASWSSTSRRYDHGLRRCRVALAHTLSSIEAVFNPPSPPTCSQLDRPVARGRMARSAAPLSIANLPSSR